MVGAGELKDVRLRGQPSSGRFRAAASWSPAKPDAARLDLTDLALRGPGIDLGGNVSVETAPMRAWFVLTGPLLDLDAVMGILPDAPAAGPAPRPPRRAGRRARPGGHAQADPVRGRARDDRDREAEGRPARGDRREGARHPLEGRPRARRADRGGVRRAGLRRRARGCRSAEKVPTWKLAAKLSGLDLEKTLAAFAGRAPLLGKLDGALEIDGAGDGVGEAPRRAHRPRGARGEGRDAHHHRPRRLGAGRRREGARRGRPGRRGAEGRRRRPAGRRRSRTSPASSR